MGIREMMNANQRGTKIGIATIAFLAVAAAGWQLWPAGPKFGTLGSFYSDDDGKTYFHDTLFKFPPFDHDGKVAYRALVFTTANGQPFVGFLQQYNAKTKKMLTDAYVEYQQGKKTQGQIEAMMSSDRIKFGTESKLSGSDKKWRAGGQINMHDLQSAGGEMPRFVMP